MENYYDMATAAELEEQYGSTPAPEEIQADRDFLAQNPDYNCQRLFWLFLDRGFPEIAQGYYDRIQDPLIRLDAAMMACECKDESAPRPCALPAQLPFREPNAL